MTDIMQSSPLYTGAATPQADYIKTRNIVLFLMISTSFIVNCLSLTGPLFMMLVYDKVLSTYSLTTLAAFCLLGLFAYILYGVLDLCRKKILSLFAARFIDNHPHIHNALMAPSAIAALDTPWIIISLAALTLIHPYLGLFGLTTVMIYIFIISYQYKLEIQNGSLSEKIEKCQMRLSKARLFLRHVPAFDISHQSTGIDISQELADLRTEQHDLRTHLLMVNSFMSWGRLVGSSAIIALGAYLAVENLISTGSLIAGSILFMRAISPLESIRGQWQSLLTLYRDMSKISDSQEVITVDEDRDYSLPKSLEKPGTLQIKNCVIGDPKHHKPLFRMAELSIPAGSIICLTGKNNAGKTVFLKGLSGIYPSLSGSLSYNKTDLSQLTPPQMMSLMSYAGERPYGSYLEEEEFTTEDRVLFSAFGLGDPEQYVAGNQNIEHLSYSTSRKYSLACSLIKQRKIILLDRPSDGLQRDDVSILVNYLHRFKQRGTTFLIATNSPFLHEQADHILTIDQGRITGRQTAEDLQKNKPQTMTDEDER